MIWPSNRQYLLQACFVEDLLLVVQALGASSGFGPVQQYLLDIAVEQYQFGVMAETFFPPPHWHQDAEGTVSFSDSRVHFFLWFPCFTDDATKVDELVHTLNCLDIYGTGRFFLGVVIFAVLISSLVILATS